MEGRNKMKSSAKLLMSAMLILFSNNYTLADSKLDPALNGPWIKAETGNRIVIKDNSEVDVFLTGQASAFNGMGSVESCSDGGANICFSGERFKCSYRYSFVQKKLSLQFRKGTPDAACQAIAGAYEIAQ